ncbi:MAG: MotA/TolQ/ExbB proton channel family protein, partial [Phycisphaerales bacterium]|nr:MotA/TolQ/ExbB proton channel family protein [Phycisphaerales bacterium]
MDLSTLVGLILGVVLILFAILLGGSIGAYIDIPSVLIVIGGCIAAILTSFPLEKVLRIPAVFKKTLKPPTADSTALIKQMVSYAEVARRDGILALEGLTDEMEDDLLILGVKMAVDGTDPELIEQILDADVENMLSRHGDGKGLFDAAGKYAPAFGMIGT